MCTVLRNEPHLPLPDIPFWRGKLPEGEGGGWDGSGEDGALPYRIISLSALECLKIDHTGEAKGKPVPLCTS